MNPMDAVFKALADSIRRELLDSLRERGGQTLGELCRPYSEGSARSHAAAQPAISRQGITKHLAVLEAANLVATVRRGREKLHYLNPVPIQEIAQRWIGPYERRHVQALATLKRALEACDE